MKRSLKILLMFSLVIGPIIASAEDDDEGPEITPLFERTKEPLRNDDRNGIEFQTAGTFFTDCQEMANKDWSTIKSSDGEVWNGEWNELHKKHMKAIKALEAGGDSSLNLQRNESGAFVSRTQPIVGAEGHLYLKAGVEVGECMTATGGDFESKGCADKFATQDQVNQAFKIDDIAEAYKEALRDAHDTREKIFTCHALIGLMQPMQSEGYSSEYRRPGQLASFDGMIKCQSTGVETQDYPACVKAVTTYNATFLGNKAAITAQQVDYTMSNQNNQEKFQDAANSGSVTSALEYQHRDTEKRQQMSQTKAALDGARVAALTAAMKGIPTMNDLMNSCHNARGGFDDIQKASKKYVDAFKSNLEASPEFIKGHIELVEVDKDSETTEDEIASDTAEEVLSETDENGEPVASTAQTGATAPPVQKKKIEYRRSLVESKAPADLRRKSCDEAAHQDVALLMNAQARQGVKGAMMAAGIDMAGALAAAKMLADQAAKLKDAMNNIEQPEIIPFAEPEFQDGLFTVCEADPEADGCELLASQARNVDAYSSGISLSGFGGNNVASGKLNNELNGDGDAAAGSNSKTPTARNGVGSIGDPAKGVTKGNDLEDRVAAGTVSTGGGGAAAGAGGGGGGPGGASAPGLGGGGGSGLGAAGKNTAAARVKSKYSGGGSYRGGKFARSRKKGKKSANPFNKFFKNKKRAPASLLFGKGVSGKKGTLFDRFSKRYTDVHKDKRLLQYEVVNGK